MTLLLGAGCSENSKIEKKAEWLCKQDLVKSPKLAGFPEEHPAENYVASSDLSLLRADAEKAGAFAALAAGLKNVGLGVQAAFAERTTCEVTVSVDDSGERALAKIKQTRPDWSMANGLEGIGELVALESKEKVQDRIGELIEESEPASKTTDFELTFVKEEDQWVVLYDIEKLEKVAEVDGELDRLRAEKDELSQALAEAKKAAEVLATLEVSESSFSKEKDSIGMAKPAIKMTVKNNTGKAIARASFIGRLSSPGRSVPWLEEPFGYKIPGGLEPGESATWDLAPNSFSAWGSVEVPADATLSLTVVSLEGANDVVIAELPLKPGSFSGERLDVDAVDAQKKAIDERISELESKKDSL